MSDFRYMLAPMEAITGNAFRVVCHKYGADMTFTEMVRVGGLARRNMSTLSRLDIKGGVPTIIQLFGSKEKHFSDFLKVFEPPEGFCGFNLNYGCPSPHVISIGQGCAMVRKISKTRRIVGIFGGHGYKVSIKMRLGMNRHDKDNKCYLNLIDSVDADFFVVHARHGMETYDDPADFGVYEGCVKTGKKIIANGDIRTADQISLLKSVGVEGVMIGRAAVINPAIFDELRGRTCPEKDAALKEILELSEKFGEPEKYRRNVLRHNRDVLALG